MMTLTISELLFYGGIIVVAGTLVLALVCFCIFYISGKKLKYQLEQEYGAIQ